MKQRISRYIDHSFWKFMVVGFVNTIFGTAIMFIFYNVFHLGYWLSSASNYFFGSILSYILNRIFTFQDNTSALKTLPRFIINIICCYILAYSIAKPVVIYFLSDYLPKVQENVAMLVAMFMFVGLNYLGQRFYVFKGKVREKTK